jgi:hypothetical protein
VPGNVPYQDAVIGMHLEILSVENDRISSINKGDEVLAYGWVMRANKLTRLARLQTGARLSLMLTDWNNVSSKYGSFNRLEPDDPMVLMLDPYWIEGDE